jgi:Transposase DDE domain group 1
MDRQMGLTARLAAAMRAKRHPSYIDHPLRDLLAQRVSPRASGYAEAKDANRLRHDPLCTWGRERLPRAADQDLARAPTCSRLEHSVDRKDLYRLTLALVDHVLASSLAPPAALGLDLDHTDAPTHGQQALAFYNHSDKSSCSLPLFIFEGTSGALVMACLRPGTRPTGVENAMIWARLLASLRHQWPETPLLIRGESHCATPEVLDTITRVPGTDVVFGRAAHAVLLRQAAAVLAAARHRHRQRTAAAQAQGEPPPTSRRLYQEFSSAAASWSQAWRVICQAEVMPAGDPPRFVVTSLTAPAPPRLSEDLYGARGTWANMRKAAQCALHSARPSETTCLANALRLLLACAAYVLHHALRTQTLRHTALAHAPPATVILPRCKVATLVRQ